MKFINLLFSIYITAISCLPCADNEIKVTHPQQTIHSETNAPAENHHHDNESCSPFCICNCCNCSGFYNTSDYSANAVIIKITTEKNKIEYPSTLFSAFQPSIWQPPQIS